MSFPEKEIQELQDLDLVSQEMIDEINSAVMRGAESMRESFLRRASPSFAEFAASCEFAEKAGLDLLA